MELRKQKWILFLFLSVLTLTAGAATLKRFDSSNGLTNSRIGTICKDRYQNVWITTDNGLNRYNGNRIVTYRHSNQDDHSLLNNMCSVVFETSQGALLVGTEDGIQQYDYENDRFETLPMLDQNGDTVRGSVFSVSESPAGCVFLSAYGDGVFQLSDGAFRRAMQYEKSDEIRLIYFDRHGRMWLTDKTGNLYQDGCLMANFPGLNSICESNLGTLYFSTQTDGCFRYVESNSEFSNVEGTDFNITAIRPAPQDGLFICTDGDGLQVFNEISMEIHPADIRIYDYDFFKSKVRDVMVDAFGNTWVAVFWKGVEVCPPQTSYFGYIGHRSANMNSIGSNCVTAVCSDISDSLLWVGTDQAGLYRLSLDHPDNTDCLSNLFHDTPGAIRSLFQDQSGNLWTGTQSGGIYMLDSRNSIIYSLKDLTGTDAQVPAILDITQDASGSIWAASNGNGIFRLAEHGGRWQLDTPVQVENGYTCSLAVLDDWLFVGTANGLELYALNGDSVSVCSRILNKTTVYDMCLSPHGTVWLATNGGLLEVDPGKGTPTILKRISYEQGLTEPQLYSLSFDGNGIIWVGTDNGIFCVDAYSDSIKAVNYKSSDGLLNTEFSSRAISCMGGRMVMAGTSGVVYFHPQEIIEQDGQSGIGPKLRICDIYVDGENLPVGHESGKDNIRLMHSMRSFSVVLSDMNPCADEFAFSYSMDGGNWVRMPRGQNNIHFDNLAFGKHKIEFRSDASDSTCMLTVVCRRPWYWSILAITIYILELLVLGILLFVAKRQRAKDEAAKLSLRKEVERVRNIKRTQELDVDSPDDVFMKRIMKCINENISNPDLNVEMIAAQVGVSRVHLYRRMKKITDMAPLDFLKTVRMREAARLLAEKNCDITQVSLATGFKYLSTFSTTFKQHYGVSPSDYINKKG